MTRQALSNKNGSILHQFKQFSSFFAHLDTKNPLYLIREALLVIHTVQFSNLIIDNLKNIADLTKF